MNKRKCKVDGLFVARFLLSVFGSIIPYSLVLIRKIQMNNRMKLNYCSLGSHKTNLQHEYFSLR